MIVYVDIDETICISPEDRDYNKAVPIEKNIKKINKMLKWYPSTKFEIGLEKTFEWYLNNYKFFKYFSKKYFFKRLGLKV